MTRIARGQAEPEQNFAGLGNDAVKREGTLSLRAEESNLACAMSLSCS